MTKDFTLNKYKNFCEALLSTGKEIYTLKDYLSKEVEKYDKKIILLRHDVDIFPKRALKMAQIEKNLGIRSSYYFRNRRHVFNKDIMNKIRSFGHEIGYHYENLADAKGDYTKSIESFRKNLLKFNSISKIHTVSMHGSSMSEYNNLDIWSRCNLSDFDLRGEAYLSINWPYFIYYTDAGGSWSSDANLRDKPLQSNHLKKQVNSTDEILREVSKDNNFYFNIHPDRWNNGISWYFELVTKKTRNYAKNLYRRHIKI